MHYKLDKNKNVVPGDMIESEKILMNKNNEKIVNQEYVGDKFISTVFLAIDHGYPQWSGHTENYKPVVFETMIYDQTKDKWLHYQERYHTWKEAEEGHKKACQWVQDGCKDET